MLRRLVVCFAVLAMSCGGPTKLGTKPSWRDGNTKAGNRTSGPQVAVFAPSGRAVERYNDPNRAPIGDEPLATAVVAAIRQAAIDAGLEPPEPDARLYAAARDLAAVVPERAPMRYPAVEFALQRHGIIEPSPHMMVIWGPIDDPAAIIEQLATRIPEILESGPFARVGFASVERGKPGEGAAILALQASHIQTQPIPRALPKGGAAVIRGTIDAPFEKPAAFLTRDTGEVVDLPVKVGRGGSFSFRFDCAERKGRQQVEVTAVDVSGSTVLANFPIWCRERPPVSISLEYDPADEVILDAEAAEKRLVELVNRDRALHKLPALTVDPRVSAIARSHSREMFETGLVAHISPRTGSASDRVRAAKLRSPVVLENVARAYGIAEAQEGLMNSPGHRANLLSEDASHFGVGVVVGEEVAGRRELFITQVFTYQTPTIDPRTVARALRARIRKSSQARQVDELTKLAQIQATEIASGVSREIATKRTSTRARKLTGHYDRIRTAVVALPRIEAFQASSVFRGDGLTAYGLGVAQGPHPELGDKAIHVVLLLAYTP